MIATRLTTERLTLRQLEAGDFPAYQAYMASARSVHIGGPYDAVKAFERFTGMIGHWVLRGFGRYAIELNGTAIGHVGLLQLDSATLPELTWSLWTGEAEGHGYATEAARAALDEAFASGVSEILVHIDPNNAGSLAVAERLGAVRLDRPAPAWLPGFVAFTLLNGQTAVEGMEVHA